MTKIPTKENNAKEEDENAIGSDGGREARQNPRLRHSNHSLLAVSVSRRHLILSAIRAVLGRTMQALLRIAVANGFAAACLLASLSIQTGYTNVNGEDGGGGGGGVDDYGNPSVFGRKYRQKSGLETLFVRSMQQIGQKEVAALLYSLGKALSHLFNQLGSPQLPKPITIPSSRASATGGILVNDANSFLSL
ncbi:uncharacterized protein MONOS_5904 [Monocercomonoides exilis]|uniref:uncharacterized protein n=1 Tax=Monocercomonoides exilis TaxID=2049356 RepID=UPI00355A20D9|nr:hypothetical protein MONOS_5904 [Monocercomonoides exilis]|eukprot:MONOS_5904.1-p1 / transcript=MONOS_5904.1 / gene=MONOS_5904 / organism=Monocercomonoides_exilis_PA203 / gene_product=unspecified product / transcript_product=unspecified product / location=Mono_scaffold00178:35611-36431(-) / protein_length=192 / sequence_SO=supercontig / SO=protein_coding / is_pseudo=false